MKKSQNKTDVSIINMLVILKNGIEVANLFQNKEHPRDLVLTCSNTSININHWLIFVYKSNGNKMNKKKRSAKANQKCTRFQLAFKHIIIFRFH